MISLTAIYLLFAQASPYDDWLVRAIDGFIQAAHPAPYSFLDSAPNILGLIAVILVSLVCGAVGSLVVGNRMAFFSDALAHTAFAGIALGFLTAILAGAVGRDFFDWATPIMVVFGILVGLGIAYVQERTSLASDTVIGVFFAGAIGFGAMLLQGIAGLGIFYNAEDFLFGSVVTITPRDVKVLVLLAALTAAALALLYNQLLFTTFNPSLARSRRIPVRRVHLPFHRAFGGHHQSVPAHGGGPAHQCPADRAGGHGLQPVAQPAAAVLDLDPPVPRGQRRRACAGLPREHLAAARRPHPLRQRRHHRRAERVVLLRIAGPGRGTTAPWRPAREDRDASPSCRPARRARHPFASSSPRRNETGR